jgi:hypothetical protein
MEQVNYGRNAQPHGTSPMTESFETAMEVFRRFIVEQGLPERTAWVFREDVTSRGRRIAVRWPVPPLNESAVRDRYETGARRGLGLRLEVLCLLNDVSCCVIWVPEDDLAASYAMLSGLKFAVPTDPITARPVRNSLTWWWICWRDRRARSGWVAESLQPRHWPELA